MSTAGRNGRPVLEVRQLEVAFGSRRVLSGIDLDVPARGVTAIVGPSGSGKSTLLRALNRLLDLVPNADVRGRVAFHGEDVYAPGADPDRLRARIGMVFQRPVVFPATIRRNVLFAWCGAGAEEEVLERALTRAALWDEVRDRLDEPARTLSVGQQQRLSIARALAVEPQVLLLDEPTSALDADSERAVEETLRTLAEERAVVLVTHSSVQVERLGASVLRLVDGRLE